MRERETLELDFWKYFDIWFVSFLFRFRKKNLKYFFFFISACSCWARICCHCHHHFIVTLFDLKLMNKTGQLVPVIKTHADFVPLFIQHTQHIKKKYERIICKMVVCCCSRWLFENWLQLSSKKEVKYNEFLFGAFAYLLYNRSNETNMRMTKKKNNNQHQHSKQQQFNKNVINTHKTIFFFGKETVFFAHLMRNTVLHISTSTSSRTLFLSVMTDWISQTIALMKHHRSNPFPIIADSLNSLSIL